MKFSQKRIDSLKGEKVRLIPKRKDDWHPVGILQNVTAQAYEIEVKLDKVVKVISEPRGEFLGLEVIE